MPGDLVPRLRDAAFYDSPDCWALCEEAADRIATLERGLNMLGDIVRLISASSTAGRLDWEGQRHALEGLLAALAPEPSEVER